MREENPDAFLADFRTGGKPEKGGAIPGPASGDLFFFLQTCKVINNFCRIILHASPLDLPAAFKYILKLETYTLLRA